MLMRARAIENGCFVFAAAQGGKHENGRETFGHSLIVDPWGRILAEGGTEPGVVMAEHRSGARSPRRAPKFPRCSMGGASRCIEPMAEPIASACGARAGMIRYALVCDQGHDFESWFQNSAAYDKQVKRGLVACPLCSSTKVEKAHHGAAAGGREKARRGSRRRAEAAAPPAPARRAATAAPAPVAMMSPQEREFRKKLKELREHLTKNADYVGQKFPEEARKMHYGETEHRSIYGEASPEQAKELHEEGIEFHPLPVLPDERN